VGSFVPVLLIGLFIAVIVLLAIFSYLSQQQRIAELTALAQQLNWHFDTDYDYSYDSEFSQFGCFCHGSSRYAYNTLRGALHVGEESWPARMGDYHYETTSTDSEGKTQTHSHHFSYLLIQLPYSPLPDLRIRHEGMFDSVKSAFGFRDINFESAEFSKRFHVTSSDKKFAYDVIYPAMMEFMLADEPPPIEIDGGQCCLTEGSGTWSAAEFQQRLNWSAKFFGLWQKHLVAELKNR
jgi:hypothetical protein